MDYKDFELEDFLTNEYFVSWILDPNIESSHFWEKWLAENPDKRALVQQAKELISSINYQSTDTLTDQEYSQILEHLLHISQKENVRTLKWNAKYAFRIAASISLLLLAYFLLRQFESTKVSDELSYREVSATTIAGQRKQVVLPDGTNIMVNAGSELKYSLPFSGEKREVSLTGEAFFDVSHDASRPFIIKSGGLETEVLGTSFNLRNYAEESEISVALVEGKVQLSSEGQTPQMLAPNEIGIYNISNGLIDVTTFNSEEIIGWTKGVLLFKDEDLPRVFKTLERYYGVRFEFEEGVKLQGSYSGRYDNEPLDVVLKGLSYTSHFEYKLDNKRVMIYESG